MFEAVEVIHKLFSRVPRRPRRASTAGQYFTLESTRLWTMPEAPPEILVATSGPVTAKRAGRTVDGLIIDGAPIEKIAGAVRPLRRGRSRGGRSDARDGQHEGAAPAPELGPRPTSRR